MPARGSQTRNRIIDAAYRTFYKYGFFRAGVDAMVAFLHADPTADDEAIVQHLTDDGLSEQQATKLVQLTDSRPRPRASSASNRLVTSLGVGLNGLSSSPWSVLTSVHALSRKRQISRRTSSVSALR